MKTVEKYLVCALVVALCLGGVSGCGSSDNTATAPESESVTASEVESETEVASETEIVTEAETEIETETETVVAAEVESETETETETREELIWPTYGLATMVPSVDNAYGEIVYDSSEGVDIIVEDISKSEYKEYVSGCQEAGFVVDYISDDEYYYAFDESGYEVWILYDKDKSTMEVEIFVPYE